MNFKDLYSDSESIKSFNGLSADLAKASAYFSSGIDPDSIADLDPDSLREVEEAYAALLQTVEAMHALFKPVPQGNINAKPYRGYKEDVLAAIANANAIDNASIKPQIIRGNFKPTKEDLLAAIKYGVS